MTRTPALPAPFLERMKALLGDDFPAFRSSLDGPPVQGLRLNTLKIGIEDGRRLLPWHLEPVPWCPSGFHIDLGVRPGKYPLHAAGLYYLQDPSAMAAAELLDVRPGHRVIDIAASPGGKSTHIASLLEGHGLLVANDPVRGRIKALGENLERWGVRNAILTNAQPADLADAMAGQFDRVLVDAPCSGEGMFRKSPAAIREWSEEHVRGCAIRQTNLLNDACRLVHPGGLLLYCTCTFAPEENEEQVSRFLKTHPDWHLEAIRAAEGFLPGRRDWADGSFPLEHMMRLWPHRAPAEGHTFALLRAPGQGQDRRSAHALPTQPAIRQADETSALWEAFRLQVAASFGAEGMLKRRRDQIYLAPPGASPIPDVSVVRPGLPLGTVRGGRFEPAHALALALRAGEPEHVVDLSDEEADGYLRGAPIHRPGQRGWVIMAYRGFPLGWGKRSNDVVKNHYPKGLRRH